MKRDIYSLTSLKILGNRTETAGSVGSARQGGFACPSIISQFCFFTTSLLSTLSWHSYSLRDSTSQGFQPQTNELDWLRFAQLIQSLLRGSGQAWVIYAPLLLAVESVLFEPHRLKINENIFLKENGVVAKRRGNISGQAKTTDIFMSSVNAWISDRWMDGWTDGLGGWMCEWMQKCNAQGKGLYDEKLTRKILSYLSELWEHSRLAIPLVLFHRKETRRFEGSGWGKTTEK